MLADRCCVCGVNLMDMVDRLLVYIPWPHRADGLVVCSMGPPIRILPWVEVVTLPIGIGFLHLDIGCRWWACRDCGL